MNYYRLDTEKKNKNVFENIANDYNLIINRTRVLIVIIALFFLYRCITHDAVAYALRAYQKKGLYRTEN